MQLCLLVYDVIRALIPILTSFLNISNNVVFWFGFFTDEILSKIISLKLDASPSSHTALFTPRYISSISSFSKTTSLASICVLQTDN